MLHHICGLHVRVPHLILLLAVAVSIFKQKLSWVELVSWEEPVWSVSGIMNL